MLQWTTRECKYLFQIFISTLLDKYLDMGLLDNMVITLLIFWGTSILFSTAAAPESTGYKNKNRQVELYQTKKILRSKGNSTEWKGNLQNGR